MLFYAFEMAVAIELLPKSAVEAIWISFFLSIFHCDSLVFSFYPDQFLRHLIEPQAKQVSARSMVRLSTIAV